MAHIIKYKTENIFFCLTPCPHFFVHGPHIESKVGSLGCAKCDYNMLGKLEFDNVLVCSYPNKVRE